VLTRNKRFFVHTFAFALVLALAGFCWGISETRSISIQEEEAQQRAVLANSPLRFTNPIISQGQPPQPNTYDLGDACFGSMITRFITATGGLRPYQYNAISNTLSGQLGLYSTLTLNPAGCVVGSIAGIMPPNTPMLLFQAGVGDSAGSSPFPVLGNFQIKLFFATGSLFRFAVDNINNGVVGQSYISKLETLNGHGEVTYSVLPGTLMVDGVPKGNSPSLEAVGLSLGSEGTISGRPLQPGRIQFTARAIDAEKRVAHDRTDSVFDQIVRFNVEDNLTCNTDYTTLSVSAKGDVGQLGKDSITFRGLLNLSGQAQSTFRDNLFMFQLGGAVYKGKLNAHGQVVNQLGGPLVLQDGTMVQITVDAQAGAISGKITNATLGKKLDGLNVANRGTKRYAVGIGICGGVIASDMLEFSTKRVGDKFQIDYRMGKIGQPLGGAFQILSVRGTDQKTLVGTLGTVWSAKFIMIPRFGIDSHPGFDSLAGATVRIGTNFVQTFTPQFLTSTAKGDIKLAKNKFQGATVSKLQFSARSFVGSFITQPLEKLGTVGTGIDTAASAGINATNNFNVGLDLTRTGGNSSFSGIAAKHIYTGSKFSHKFHEWVDALSQRVK
jgi:hypothetical protein